jgi:hypothetical protein
MILLLLAFLIRARAIAAGGGNAGGDQSLKSKKG